MDTITLLKRAELFRDLDDDQLEQIAGISAERQYTAGSVIFEQGSTGDGMYLVCDGQVEVQVRDSSGSTFPALYLGVGQVFGEMALVDEGARSASVIAASPETRLIHIANDSFTDLCRDDTSIGYIMMRNIAQDLSFKLRHRDFDPASS